MTTKISSYTFHYSVVFTSLYVLHPRVSQVDQEAQVQLEPREPLASTAPMAHPVVEVQMVAWEHRERGGARGCRETLATLEHREWLANLVKMETMDKM